MEYLILLLVLVAAFEYLRRERMHRRALDHLRIKGRAMPADHILPRSWRVSLRAAGALLVLALALALVAGVHQATGVIFRVLGIALIPVSLILALMAVKESSRNRSTPQSGVIE